MPRRPAGTRHRELEPEGEVVVYGPRQGVPVSLNSSARAIWELCDGGRTVEGIGRELGRRLGCPPEALAEDVRTTVARLAELEVVELGPAAAVEPAAIDWRRVAEPQGDGHDTEAALAVAAANLAGYGAQYALPPEPAAPRILGGVEVRHAFRQIGEGRPGPELADAPANHPNIARALDYLEHWPEVRDQFGRLMRVLHPLLDASHPDDERGFLGGSRSHGIERLFGAMWSTVNCPLMLADNMVHEMAHQKLFGLGVFKEGQVALVTNDPSELYVSPVIVDRKRPMSAVLHGVYAFCYVVALELRLVGTLSDERRRRQLAERLARNASRLEQGVGEIREHVRPDAAGGPFLEGLYTWIERMVGEARAVAR